MLEGESQVLGEIGEVTGRKMEAGKGPGSLEKRGEVLLKFLAEEGKGIGWRRLGDWSLSPGYRGDSQTTLSGHSLLWKWGRQRRRGRSCRWKKGSGNGSLNCSLRSLTLSGFALLLKVHPPTEGGTKERLISGGGRLLARFRISNSSAATAAEETARRPTPDLVLR